MLISLAAPDERASGTFYIERDFCLGWERKMGIIRLSEKRMCELKCAGISHVLQILRSLSLFYWKVV